MPVDEQGAKGTMSDFEGLDRRSEHGIRGFGRALKISSAGRKPTSSCSPSSAIGTFEAAMGGAGR